MIVIVCFVSSFFHDSAVDVLDIRLLRVPRQATRLATTAVSKVTSPRTARTRLCPRRASAATRLDMCRVTARTQPLVLLRLVVSVTDVARRATSLVCARRPVVRLRVAVVRATTAVALVTSRVTALRRLVPCRRRARSVTTVAISAISRATARSHRNVRATPVARTTTWLRSAHRLRCKNGQVNKSLAATNIALTKHCRGTDDYTHLYRRVVTMM